MRDHTGPVIGHIAMGAVAPKTPVSIHAAAPEGAPPRRISNQRPLKLPCPAVPRRGPEAGSHRSFLIGFIVVRSVLSSICF